MRVDFFMRPCRPSFRTRFFLSSWRGVQVPGALPGRPEGRRWAPGWVARPGPAGAPAGVRAGAAVAAVAVSRFLQNPIQNNFSEKICTHRSPGAACGSVRWRRRVCEGGRWAWAAALPSPADPPQPPEPVGLNHPRAATAAQGLRACQPQRTMLQTVPYPSGCYVRGLQNHFPDRSVDQPLVASRLAICRTTQLSSCLTSIRPLPGG